MIILSSINGLAQEQDLYNKHLDSLEIQLENKEDVSMVKPPTKEIFTMNFSEALRLNIDSYRRKSITAYKYKDHGRAHFLYDSLINHCLKGTFFDSFKIKQVDGGTFSFKELKKPVFLKTTSEWCEPNISEIDALNDVADEFEDMIDFVVIYWNPRKKVQKISRKYNRNIRILFVDENDNKSSHILKTLKHSLGLPTIITMTKNKQILNVMKGVSPRYLEEKNTGISSYGRFEGKESKNHYENSYKNYFNLIKLYVDELASKYKSIQKNPLKSIPKV